LATGTAVEVDGAGESGASGSYFPAVQPLFGKHQHLQGEGRDVLISKTLEVEENRTVTVRIHENPGRLPHWGTGLVQPCELGES
jgi:hypothetical protein